MLTLLAAAAAGLVCGVLSGFGIGGGSLLMVWMTAVCAVGQKTAQGINLLYFLPTAAAALIFHAKNRLIDWRAVLPAAAAGCATAEQPAKKLHFQSGRQKRAQCGGFFAGCSAAFSFLSGSRRYF